MLPGEKMNFRLNIRNAGFWNSGPGCLHYGAKSNDDSDGKENGKKSKTTPLHVHHAFLYMSLPSLQDYD